MGIDIIHAVFEPLPMIILKQMSSLTKHNNVLILLWKGMKRIGVDKYEAWQAANQLVHTAESYSSVLEITGEYVHSQ